jgi:type I restriction enzyme S subunit
MPRAEWKDAGTFRVAIPPVDAATAFNEVTSAVYCTIRALVHENRTLTILRDTLLPRLISGQLRVPAANSTEATA